MLDFSRLRTIPNTVLLCVAALALAAGLLTAFAALREPWLPAKFRVTEAESHVVSRERSLLVTVSGTEAELLSIAAEGDARLSLAPRASDLIEEPDLLPSYAEIDGVLERQARLAAILSAPAVRLTLRDRNGTRDVVLEPARRPLADLPPAFWVQLVTGVGGLLIGGWVWALRRNDWAARLLALSGAGLMISALPAAIYGTRQLAIDADLFRFLMALNHVGSQIFGGAVIGLFLRYPVALVQPRWLTLLPALIVPVLLADLLRIGVEPAFYYLSILLEMAAIVALIGVQWFRTRRDPSARAALAWLGVSVVVGAGSWTVIAAAPIVLGGTVAISQGYSFGLFLLIYLGLALGVSRYRLFELGDWAFRILFFTLGTLLLLAVDAALVLAVHLDRAPALGLALLLVGFLYLPLRDRLWRMFTRGRRLADHELFGAAMDVALAPAPGQRAERWRALMQRLFDPLEIGAIDVGAAPRIARDGVELLVPAIAGSPGLRLGFPWSGRGLFGPADVALARHFVDLVNQAEASRQSYERGVIAERRRMAQDLHDDVGARLLSGLHTADERTRPILHAAMADIRSIVSGLGGERAPLDRVLAEVRHECARRLEVVGCALDWPPLPEEETPVLLDYRLHKALTSSVREAVTNVIRHAGARQLAVAVERDGGRLVLTLADDGVGLPQAALDGKAPGQGLRGMARRLRDIGGSASMISAGHGTVVRLEFPLAHVSDPPAAPDRGAAPPGGADRMVR